MITEDKWVDMVEKSMQALTHQGFATFADKGMALREARRTGLQYLSKLKEHSRLASEKIRKMRNAPPEHSTQWEVLHRQFIDELTQRKS